MSGGESGTPIVRHTLTTNARIRSREALMMLITSGESNGFFCSRLRRLLVWGSTSMIGKLWRTAGINPAARFEGPPEDARRHARVR
jgi:hypothetical protein